MANKPLLSSLIGAAGIIALALIARALVANDTIDYETSKRVMGVSMGLFFIIYGNAIPKAIEPLADERCGIACGQRRRRIVGWSFVLAGLAYTIVWLALPVELARIVGKVAIVANVLVLATVTIRSIITRRRTQVPSEC